MFTTRLGHTSTECQTRSFTKLRMTKLKRGKFIERMWKVQAPRKFKRKHKKQQMLYQGQTLNYISYTRMWWRSICRDSPHPCFSAHLLRANPKRVTHLQNVLSKPLHSSEPQWHRHTDFMSRWKGNAVFCSCSLASSAEIKKPGYFIRSNR